MFPDVYEEQRSRCRPTPPVGDGTQTRAPRRRRDKTDPDDHWEDVRILVIRPSMKQKLFVSFARSLLILALLLPACKIARTTDAQAQSQSASHYPAGSGYPAPILTLFQNEQQAETHCPRDTVVWLNLSSASITSWASGGTPTPSMGPSSVSKRRT